MTITKLRHSCRAIHSDQSGAALVEFALVLPLLVLLLLGMLDFGKAFNYWIDENHLAAEGARFAAVNKNPGPGATLQESIKAQADTAELKNGGTSSVPSALQVCIEFPNGSSNVGDPVKVRVTTSYHFLSFVASKLSIAQKTMSSEATMRLERPPTYGASCA